MSTNGKQRNPGERPSVAILVQIAAQSRFSNESPQQAAAGALELWQACDSVLQAELSDGLTSRPQIPLPQSWPASNGGRAEVPDAAGSFKLESALRDFFNEEFCSLRQTR